MGYKEKIMTYVIASPTSDLNSHTQAAFPDLVNNLEIFRENFSDEDILELTDWNDDTEYSNLESIDELIERLDGDYDPTYTYTVRVPIDYIYSSAKERGGYDRTIDVNTKQSYVNTCKGHLNEKVNGETKGFRQDDALTMHGMIRQTVITDFDTGAAGEVKKLLVVTKDQGNNRVLMKLLANKGKVTDVRMDVRFHSAQESDYISVESEIHTTDAGNRNGQNEEQKFHSGYRSGRKEFVECYNFLYKYNLNYNGIMQIEGVENADERLSLSNIMGFNAGEGNGIFKKYGQLNVVHAIDTIQALVKITGENTIPITPIWCLALMYKTLTDCPMSDRDKSPVFTKDQLHEFFIRFWKNKNHDAGFGGSSYFGVNQLTQTGGIKNYAYIVARMFWEDGNLIRWYKSQRKRSKGFSADCAPMKYLLEQTDEFMKKEVNKLVA